MRRWFRNNTEQFFPGWSWIIYRNDAWRIYNQVFREWFYNRKNRSSGGHSYNDNSRYGDFSPSTPEGRLFAVFIMFVYSAILC